MHACSDLAMHAAVVCGSFRVGIRSSGTHEKSRMHGGVALWKLLEDSEICREPATQYSQHVEVCAVR